MLLLPSLVLATPSFACQTLVFENAWVREPPPVAGTAAAYVTISNTAEETVSVKEVKSNCCKHVMLHESIHANGKVQMKHLEELEIPGDSTVSLAPLGKHIMLVKPESALVNGDRVAITFVCTNDKQVAVPFTVNKE